MLATSALRAVLSAISIAEDGLTAEVQAHRQSARLIFTGTPHRVVSHSEPWTKAESYCSRYTVKVQVGAGTDPMDTYGSILLRTARNIGGKESILIFQRENAEQWDPLNGRNAVRSCPRGTAPPPATSWPPTTACCCNPPSSPTAPRARRPSTCPC